MSKRMLNTLYINTQGVYVHKEGETVVVELKGEKLIRIPFLNLSGLVGFGNVTFSPFLLGACSTNGIMVSMLTENGRFLASVHGPISGNVLPLEASRARLPKITFLYLTL